MVRLNLADIEEKDFSDLPKNRYHVLITDGSVENVGDEAKHPGNEYWNIEMTVQDGRFEGRKMWTNAMLPPYEPFTIKALARASGKFSDDQINSNKFDLELFPEDADEGVPALLDGTWEFIVVYGYNKKSKRMEPRRFEPYDPDTWAPEGDEEDSMLP